MEMSIDEIIIKEKESAEKIAKISKFQRTADAQEDMLLLELSKEMIDYHNTVANIMLKYQQLQVEYENQLKADEINMLEELQKEIEETVNEEKIYEEKWAKGLSYSTKIIQQKIDKLRGDKNEK